jgi:glutamyl-tRNA synthetase
VRTALFNWLAVHNAGGEFILRSDDTDRERSSGEYQDDIVDGLRWLGLDWDEGIEVGGPHGTYRQSDRLGRYQEVADQLLQGGSAYRCFCTPAELDERRRAAQQQGRPPGYDGRCRELDAGTVAGRAAGGELYVVRLAIERPGVTRFVDLVRDEVEFDHDHVDDFVLLRSDGTPTYHLASTVDDVDYEITHVVRGEDLLSSTPKHIAITVAMRSAVPTYAHLPLLMGPDGKKLSKRHGDTALAAYIDKGILPEAMANYLALLGWSFGDDVTIFDRAAAVERFSLEAVQKNPAVFDNEKLEWMNGAYIRDLSPSAFVELSAPWVEKHIGRSLEAGERERYGQLAPLIQERAKLLSEVGDQAEFLFLDEVGYDDASWQKVMTKPETKPALEGALKRLAGLARWEAGGIEEELRAMLDELELNARTGLQPVRVAVTGSSVSPPLFESLEVLGMDRSLGRIRRALDKL